MKKATFALLIGCVSSVAFAQSIVPTEKIIETVEYSIMSKDVIYTAKPTVKAVPNGFMVNIPEGKVKHLAQTPVKAFSFPMTEDGKVGDDMRYKVQLNELSEIFPSLEKMLQTQKVTYSLLDYVGKFVPAKGFVESQILTVENLNMPMPDMNANASAGKIVFTDNAQLLPDEKIKQENKLSLNNITLSHPMATATIQSLDFAVVMPEVTKASNPFEQMIKTPSAQQTLALNGVVLTSALAGSDTVSFNLTQSLDAKQNQTDYNVDVTFKMDISDFKMTNQKDLPSSLSIDTNISGFTFAQALSYSAAMDRLSENENLPDSPRKQIILKPLQAEAEKTYRDLTENMVLTLNQISVKSDNYAVVLKGKSTVKDQTFKGTLQVTNFDYLAPQPKVIDEVACQAVVDKMLSGELAGEAFQAQYNATCEDGAGILESLRPYAATATKVKDANGKDALLFDIQFAGENLFINGQKVDKTVYENPMELLN